MLTETPVTATPAPRYATRQSVLAACVLATSVFTAACADIVPSDARAATVSQRGVEHAAHESCHPTRRARPVCPAAAPAAEATFIDPSAEIVGSEHVELGTRVYVAPFAQLFASRVATIRIGEETNVQDNVTIHASFNRDAATTRRMKAVGLAAAAGVEIGERVILAHGTTVKGPAKIGVGGGNIGPNPDNDQEVFLSFGSEVDGAILERNTGISVLGRVGPGVILRSGYIVLPGKNVTTQAHADDPSLGKVRLITEADVAFNEAVMEVNVALAREYTHLFNDTPALVRGISNDPGRTSFNAARNLPVLAGRPTSVSGFRNRIIGEVRMDDRLSDLDRVMGRHISIRADEGEPFDIGKIRRMGDDVIFHALEHSSITTGDNVTYGAKSIVHGGGRRPLLGGGTDEPTIIKDNVTLRPGAVVFRSLIGAGATIGRRSAIVNTDVAPGRVIPDRTIYVNDAVYGRVEW